MIWAILVILVLLAGGAFAQSVSGGTGQTTDAPPVPFDWGSLAFDAPAPIDATASAVSDLDLFGFLGGDVITENPATWPTGDKYWDIAHAIAFAEGANVKGDNPDRLNNPGDISDWANTYGYEQHSGSKVTHFPDKETGWNKLYQKLVNIGEGVSESYSPDMTWTQIAQKWAGNWRNWVSNVTAQLGVDPNSTFGDFVNS